VKACENERKELGSVGHLQERKNKFADELRDKRKTLRTCEVVCFTTSMLT
jgi:hypothetical protein